MTTKPLQFPPIYTSAPSPEDLQVLIEQSVEEYDPSSGVVYKSKTHITISGAQQHMQRILPSLLSGKYSGIDELSYGDADTRKLEGESHPKSERSSPSKTLRLVCGGVSLKLRKSLLWLQGSHKQTADDLGVSLPVGIPDEERQRTIIRQFLSLERKAALGEIKEERDIQKWKAFCNLVDVSEYHRRFIRPARLIGQLLVDANENRIVQFAFGTQSTIDSDAIAQLAFLEEGEWFEADVDFGESNSIVRFDRIVLRPDYSELSNEQVDEFLEKRETW